MIVIISFFVLTITTLVRILVSAVVSQLHTVSLNLTATDY